MFSKAGIDECRGAGFTLVPPSLSGANINPSALQTLSSVLPVDLDQKTSSSFRL